MPSVCNIVYSKIKTKKSSLFSLLQLCWIVFLFFNNKPRGASPGREDGISTNNLVSYYFMVFSREILKKGGSAPRATD